jgi:hypothetical protein
MRCLLLTFDCLPRRWIGCYGSLDSTTRGFDRLAASGTIFDNAVSHDVRSNATTFAGLRWVSDGSRPHALAGGQPLPFPSLHLTSQDQSVARPKSRRRTESRLSQELHKASAWMRDQVGSSLAWVRHPGLQLPDSESAPQENVAELLDQQAVIDEELDAFLDEWLDCADERWTFVLTSGRGLLRARTTARRRSDPAPAISDDLARVPFMVLKSRGEGFGRRRLELLPTTALALAIADNQPDSPDSLTDRLESLDPARFITIQGDDGAIAVRTADWLFVRSAEPDREPGEGLLFRKPEDVCDVFDVRSLESDVAIRLDALIGA